MTQLNPHNNSDIIDSNYVNLVEKEPYAQHNFKISYAITFVSTTDELLS